MFASRSTLSKAIATHGPHVGSRGKVRLFIASLGLVCLVACGASINGTYESDVRFEHCMALDNTAEIKPPIRNACWDEWLKFYTFGQPADRIDYAQVRLRQIRGNDDPRLAQTLATASPTTDAVPEPTSALAPPPMMLVVDAGPPEPTPPEDPSPKPPGSECTNACEANWTKCKKECVTPMCNRQTCISKCEKTCKDEHAMCMRVCFL